MASDWWAVGIAAIAAAVAIWQAVIARGARKDAQKAQTLARQASADAQAHEAAALRAAQEAAGSATRSADAQERLASAYEGQVEKPTWRKQKLTITTWKITNVSGHALQWVTPVVDDPRLQVVGDLGDGFDEIGPRESIEVMFDFSEGQKTYASLQLLWPDSRGNQQVEEFTFEWGPPQRIIFG